MPHKKTSVLIFTHFTNKIKFLYPMISISVMTNVNFAISILDVITTFNEYLDKINVNIENVVNTEIYYSST